MTDAQGSDVQLNGGGTVDSGTYRTISVNGVGTLRGDIACDVLRVNGAATASGDVRANTVEVNGTARIDGTLQAHTLSVNGETTLSRGAGVGTLTAKGRLTAYGDLNTRTLDARGSLSTTGSITGDTVVVEGIITADRITARSVDIGLHGPAAVREIDGQEVTVRRGMGWAGWSVMAVFGERRLTSTSIAANAVNLELTTANLVRAGNAIIGDGCRIGKVSYTGTLDQRDGAAITTAEKVDQQ